MAKVRFSCPRCQAVMQTGEEKIGFDIECPQCNYRFTLVEPREKQLEPTIDRNPVDSDPITRKPISAPPETEAVPEPTRHQITQADLETPSHRPPSENPYKSPGLIPPVYQGHADREWQCRYCNTRQPPMWKSEISTVGWIVLAVLLVTTCIFFWVGLLIRDKYPVCSVCKVRLPSNHQ